VPNRYATSRDFSESRALAKVSLSAAAFYACLFFEVDDFGRLPADAEMLKAKAFPYRRDVRGTDCSRWLAECEEAGLLVSYEADGAPYLYLTAYQEDDPKGKKRFRRAEVSRYPDPPCNHLLANARGSPQMLANASKCTGTVPGNDTGNDTPPTPPSGGAAAPLPGLFDMVPVEAKLREPRRPKAASLPASDPLFEKFWSGYPRKEAKGNAFDAWAKLTGPDRLAAANKAVEYGNAWSGAPTDRLQYRALPASWLNARRFEDDPTAWYIQAGKPSPPPKPKPKDYARGISELEAVLQRQIAEMRKNEKDLADLEFSGRLTEQGRLNYAELKQSDIDRIRETRAELEALKQEAAHG